MSEIKDSDRRQKIEAEIRRVEEAKAKTKIAYLRKDYDKHLKRLKKALATTLVLSLVWMGLNTAAAETEQMWVLCNPESYVCVRESPKKGATVGGYLYCGDEVETDGKSSGGFLHLVSLGTEMGEGWVYQGYLDYSEPQQVNYSARVLKKQTRARGCIDGEVKKRLKKGTVVTVYAENLKWCVTSMGYIQTDLLEEVRK